MKFLPLITLTLIASPAAGQQVTSVPNLPPARYDYNYHGIIAVRRGTVEELKAACHHDDVIVGCTRRAPTHNPSPDEVCQIWIIDDATLAKYPHEKFEIIYRHEQGHCNGWSHDATAKTPDVPPLPPNSPPPVRPR